MAVPVASLPTIGQPNSTQDPVLRSVLAELQAILTAGVDATNLSAGAVTSAKMATAATSATYVTTLPGSPVDGQEIFFAADATNGVIWHLRYRSAASGSYKWEFVGGAPLLATVTALQNTGSGSYTDLTTVGPTVTLPTGVGGDFQISYGADFGSNNGSAHPYMSIAVGAAAAGDADAITILGTAVTNAVPGLPALQTIRLKTGVAAAAAITAKYKVAAVANAYFANRWVRVLPVRVG